MKRGISMGVLLLVVAGAAGLWFGGGSVRPLAPVAQLPDGGVYRGALRGGRFEGPGSIEWPNGRRYRGEFAAGLFQGRGELSFADGSVYRGNFAAGLQHGLGELTQPEGVHYRGQFRRGLIEGVGTMQLGDQRAYRGQFVAGSFQGQGELSDGDMLYRGGFLADRYHGAGSMQLADGSRYVGEFQRGEFHGRGTFTDMRGDQYSGDFVEGAFSGQGTWTGEQGSYVGTFRDWLYHGQGTLTESSGDIYAGEFVNGALTGQGSHLRPDGSRYQGEFVNYRYHGDGTLTEPDGSVYRGGFRYGRRHGAGEVISGDGGPSYRGTWRWGELVSADKPGLVSPVAMQVEQALYRQDALLQEQLAAVAPSNPALIDIFFVGVAGDGRQRVFEREMDFVDARIAQRYGAAERSALLVNSRNDSGTYPLATLTSLQRLLQGVAAKMDPEQDVLFLYLTSHGSEEHELVLEHEGMALPDLPAERLAAMVESLPLKWKVIVISACYSGGFIPHLQNEHTLVMTSAAADRTSFGCSDDSDATWFGRALFQEALPRADDLPTAFDMAKQLVSEWEAEQDYEASSPQLHAPAALLAQLARWRDQHEKHIASESSRARAEQCPEARCDAAPK